MPTRSALRLPLAGVANFPVVRLEPSPQINPEMRLDVRQRCVGNFARSKTHISRTAGAVGYLHHHALGRASQRANTVGENGRSMRGIGWRLRALPENFGGQACEPKLIVDASGKPRWRAGNTNVEACRLSNGRGEPPSTAHADMRDEGKTARPFRPFHDLSECGAVEETAFCKWQQGVATKTTHIDADNWAKAKLLGAVTLEIVVRFTPRR